jgi:phage terminase large subunit GpA-like protein
MSSRAESNVGQKAAQMGYTETMLNLTFYNIDILRRDCLYVLPAKTPDAHDFSASRFDPALELSDYLTKLFSDVQNIGHKRAGSVNLYVSGSRSRSGLKSIPAGFLVMDELDEFDQENIPLAMERQSGQKEKQNWKISTPTHDGEGD